MVSEKIKQQRVLIVLGFVFILDLFLILSNNEKLRVVGYILLALTLSGIIFNRTKGII